ncbi:3785_t:CDS:2 [Funneliformis geosporum]|uniref:RNA helicase n=1 Tax=Funneliformis geosporum TaxID=1117311 RepID=A0A9W4SB63_9GLOM|nr:7569_t:CDS:2 [Funneliformis geosporum]CAI2163437.1 3785_t:CDS:2 [Funneliformis geosporum]
MDKTQETLKLLKPKPAYKIRPSSDDFMKNKKKVSGNALKPLLKKVIYKYPLKKYEMPQKLLTLFEMNAFKQLSTQLDDKNYSKFFSELLYAEEYKTNEELKRYDRQKVELVQSNNPRDHFKMKMGKRALAEKRPSVLPGDFIFVVKCGEKKAEAYQGFVIEVLKSSIVVKFDVSFLQKVYKSNVRFDVRFTFNRISMRRMHQAITNTKMDFTRLFPQNYPKHTASEKVTQVTEFYNTSNSLNSYQNRAVAIIKSGNHHPWPFIVFGKSSTIVEAMCQLLDDNSKTRILACAASNAAANWLLKKLSERLTSEKMVRINAFSQEPEKLDQKLHSYCVIQNGKYEIPNVTYIEARQIIVTTCITAGTVYSLGRTKEYTHIFIDEAGQALEPEIVTALQNASENTKIIIAGDPKQLGPLVRSSIALELGLGKSLIERLEESEFYDFSDTSIYGVKLLMNYRSHPKILSFPNVIFYGNDLKPSADKITTHNLCNFSLLPKKNYPIIFWDVKGKEDREGQSPSWFNAREAHYVLYVVKELQKENVKPEEIGIVTPYVKQVEKIKKLLKNKDISGVDIGTVEKFQGQERRVIIISTVRTESVKFLGEPRRFCVAVTRAKALLVVIGDGDALSNNNLWNQWLKEVKEYGGFLKKRLP